MPGVLPSSNLPEEQHDLVSKHSVEVDPFGVINIVITFLFSNNILQFPLINRKYETVSITENIGV